MKKSKFLVSKTELIQVDFVVCYKGNNVIYMTSEEYEKLENKDFEDVENYYIKIRKPTYGDSVEIMGTLFKNKIGENIDIININPLKLRLEKLSRLIVEWNLEDEKGEILKINRDNIFNLDQSFGNFISEKMEEKLS